MQVAYIKEYTEENRENKFEGKRTLKQKMQVAYIKEYTEEK